MCLNPRWIYKSGKYKESNYRGEKGAFYELGTFAECGACSQCIAKKANNWVVRNYYEEKKHQKKAFITLTYENNPVILVKKDLQDFIKRLRRHLDYTGQNKIRIFAAGEYGTINCRPHFHVIIYGWNDPNATFLNINKKKQLVKQSALIQKIWGLGRTSYQEYSEREAPYIALYNSAKETFKKAYKINHEKLRKLEDYSRSPSIKFKKAQRKNLQAEIKKMQAQLENSKKQYMIVKEFNTWSIALGWEEFEKSYYKTCGKYVFTEYIQDAEYATPSPWVKKLANAGDYHAAQEMFRREEQQSKETNEEREKIAQQLKLQSKRRKEHQEFQEIMAERGTKDEF